MTDDEINIIIDFLNKSGLLNNMNDKDMKKILNNYSKLINKDDTTNEKKSIDSMSNNSNNRKIIDLINDSNNKLKNHFNTISTENNEVITEHNEISMDTNNSNDDANDVNDNANDDANDNANDDANDNDANDDANSANIIKSILDNNIKKDNINNSNDKLRSNLKSIREKIEDNYNILVETEDKINSTYNDKMNNIRKHINNFIEEKNKITNDCDKIEEKIKNIEHIEKNTTIDTNTHTKKNTSTRTSKFNIPPLDLNSCSHDAIKKNENENKFDLLHKKLLDRINNKGGSYSPLLSFTDGYNHRPPHPYSARPSTRHPPSRFTPNNPYERSPPLPPQTSRFHSHLDNYWNQRYLNTEHNIFTPRQHIGVERGYSDSYYRPQVVNTPPFSVRSPFEELYKKYDIDKISNDEIIITATAGPNDNPLEIINNAIDKFEKELYSEKSNKSNLRSIFDKIKNNKKYINVKYDKDEQTYYDSLEEAKKEKIDKIENKISSINNIKTPLRFKVLQSNLPLHNKSMIINKIEDIFSNKLLGGSETTKYSNWINSLLKVPFKKYKKLPIDVNSSNSEDIGTYLIDVKKTLDTAVYGHTKTKEQVIQIIAQWITNPNSIGNCIGIQGVMGNGKTTLVKNGIAKAIDRPFAFITLGGCSDSSFLEGHNYTYEGSMWGKIVDVLIECKCMNPVFYFDELDKVSETPKGEEIINSLIHLTDASQNNQYTDKYFNGIEFDISKSLFIFSYNDISKINPILLDRLITIKTDAFKLEDKVHIAKNYLLREIYSQLCIDEDSYQIEEDNIKYIIETYTNDEGGVRTLKKHLYNIFSKFNLLNLTKNDETIKYTFDLDKKLLEKKIITQKIIDIFIKETKDKENDEVYKNWYI